LDDSELPTEPQPPFSCKIVTEFVPQSLLLSAVPTELGLSSISRLQLSFDEFDFEDDVLGGMIVLDGFLVITFCP
jgi:hypothetical protein